MACGKWGEWKLFNFWNTIEPSAKAELQFFLLVGVPNNQFHYTFFLVVGVTNQFHCTIISVGGDTNR
jgi:hypothetical protein